MRGENLTALNYYEQDTRYQAARAFAEALYPDHLHHHNVAGTMESIANLQLSDLTAFHAQHYGRVGWCWRWWACRASSCHRHGGKLSGGWHNPINRHPSPPPFPP
ncbi:MAG UNVERIFIED_CONTAM: hypothetical protein LVT10_18630 [Anaerolineae bacterium]